MKRSYASNQPPAQMRATSAPVERCMRRVLPDGMSGVPSMKDWKSTVTRRDGGYFELRTDATHGVEVRLFVSASLLDAAEDTLYGQIVNATAFPGVKLVVITPDVHY